MSLQQQITTAFNSFITNLTKNEKKHPVGSLVLRTTGGFVCRYPLAKALENQDEFFKITIRLLAQAQIEDDDTITIDKETTPTLNGADLYNASIVPKWVGRLRANSDGGAPRSALSPSPSGEAPSGRAHKEDDTPDMDQAHSAIYVSLAQIQANKKAADRKTKCAATNEPSVTKSTGTTPTSSPFTRKKNLGFYGGSKHPVDPKDMTSEVEKTTSEQSNASERSNGF